MNVVFDSFNFPDASQSEKYGDALGENLELNETLLQRTLLLMPICKLN